MKQRDGFVSNSSTCSFVIAVKDGDFSENHVLELLRCPKGHPMRSFAKEVADILTCDLEEINRSKYEPGDWEALDNVPEGWPARKGELDGDNGFGMDTPLSYPGWHFKNDKLYVTTGMI